MKNIKLNNYISIDLQSLVESRLLIQANSGSGKSWLIRRILEQSHGKVQQIVLDLEGEFSTLREKFDYVLVGKGGDVPASIKTAALLAQKLLELNVSAIIDLYELPAHERKHFAKLFLESMINAPKELWHNCLVFIDETHFFCPEKGESEAAGAVIDLATRGRKRGYCAILATQRISKLSKDAAAECNNKLIGRSSQDIDMKRAADELGFIGREQINSLRTLKPGEFYVFGPAVSNEVQKTTIGAVQTSHPKVGSRSFIKVEPPTDKIKSALKRMADLPREAEKKITTEKELREEIIRLKRERVRPVDEKMIQARIKSAIEATEKVYKLENKKLGIALEQIGKIVSTLVRNKQKEICVSTGIHIKEIPARYTDTAHTRPVKKELIISNMKLPLGNDDTHLTNPERRILNAIAWMESIGIDEPEQTAVAFLAGYTYGGGAFNNPKGALRSKGLVEYRGPRIILTEAGRDLSTTPEEALTTEQLHEKVLSILPAPAQKLLKPLLEVYPDSLTNDELAGRAGYAPNAGAFNNPRGRLRSLGLIEYLSGGQVRAKSLLFLENGK